ncbi:MAG: cytochrome c biogenesis protein [Gemmatales bacterium]|nr:cytochrome c biogenesis protein [Gemmatales bacterium]MDW8387010.1 cytochrome c biogenesis protein CcsA [Gemmatales bacterium]
MLERITILCFAASYGVALLLEAMQLLLGRSEWRRLAALLAGAAGLFAHTVYVVYHGLPMQGGPSSLLFVSWVLAIFYLVGTLHHPRLAWGVFVLPVVLVLVVAAKLIIASEPTIPPTPENLWFWAWLHAVLLILGSVGLSVGFVASVMFLVQAWKLKHKTPPGEGIQLLSLERLEVMNRRAITWAFPLFTAGLVIGLALLLNQEDFTLTDPKVIVTGLFWAVFALLLYLRYGLHIQGRRMALGTMIAFGIMLLAYVVQYIWPSAHPSGGGP